MSERDFLIIFEEPDDGPVEDDALVLDVDAPSMPSRGELDLEQRVEVELTNTASRLGLAGFIVASLGAALGIGLLIAFSLSYPEAWYENKRIAQNGAIPLTLLLSVLTLVLLVAGTMLTHYGRRIQARGNLEAVRIVEKTAHAHASFSE